MAGVPVGAAKAAAKSTKATKVASGATKTASSEAQTVTAAAKPAGRFDGFSKSELKDMHASEKQMYEMHRKDAALNPDSKWHQDQMAKYEKNMSDLDSHMSSMGEEVAQVQEQAAKAEISAMDQIKATAKEQLKEKFKNHVESNLSLGGGQAGVGQSVDPNAALQSELAQKQAEQAEREAQKQEEIQEVTQESAQSLSEKTESLKSKLQDKLERIDSGPHGAMAIYSSRWILIAQMLLDAAIGLIPGVGDMASFFFFLSFWAIPCFLLFDLGAFVRIVFFLLIDMVIGFVPGIGDVADFAPEIIAMIISQGPPRAVLNAYNSKKEARKQHLRKQYNQKMRDLKDKTRTKLKKKVDQIKGHFSGIAVENQKIVFLLIMIGIAVVGPFGLGLMTLDGGTTSLIIGGLIVFSLAMADVFGMIENKQLFAIIMFLVLNLAGLYVLQFSDSLPFLGEGGGAIFTILFFFFTILYILHTMDYVSTATIGKIVIITSILIVTPFLIGRFSNPELFQGDVATAKIKAEQIREDANLIDRIVYWVEQQYGLGDGDEINTGELEKSHEFKTIKIESVDPLKEEFLEGEEIVAYVYYYGDVPNPTSLRTVCRSGEVIGEADPSVFDVSTSSYPQVKCTFDQLSRGPHSLEVYSFYSYKSSLDIPLRFMEKTVQQRLLEQFRLSGEDKTLEEHTGGKPILATNAGPIYINPANAKKDGMNFLDLPIIIDRTNPQRTPIRLNFQLKKSPEDTTGEVQEITKLTFKLPQGMTLTCDGINNGNPLLSTPDGNGKYVATATYGQFDIEINDFVACEININPAMLDLYVPTGASAAEWTAHTITLSVDYNYAGKKTGLVRVV